MSDSTRLRCEGGDAHAGATFISGSAWGSVCASGPVARVAITYICSFWISLLRSRAVFGLPKTVTV